MNYKVYEAYEETAKSLQIIKEISKEIDDVINKYVCKSFDLMFLEKYIFNKTKLDKLCETKEFLEEKFVNLTEIINKLNADRTEK